MKRNSIMESKILKGIRRYHYYFGNYNFFKKMTPFKEFARSNCFLIITNVFILSKEHVTILRSSSIINTSRVIFDPIIYINEL